MARKLKGPKAQPKMDFMEKAKQSCFYPGTFFEKIKGENFDETIKYGDYIISGPNYSLILN